MPLHKIINVLWPPSPSSPRPNLKTSLDEPLASNIQEKKQSWGSNLYLIPLRLGNATGPVRILLYLVTYLSQWFVYKQRLVKRVW